MSIITYLGRNLINILTAPIVNKIILFITAVVIIGCTSTKNKVDDPILAKVYDKYLYRSQLSEIFPQGISAEDSMLILGDHVDKWLRNQLLLHIAEMNLSEKEKNVEQQIDDYRTSLMIFKYEQNFIKEKLDTLISDEDIEEYYANYSSNFILNNNLLKGSYVRVSRSSPEIWKVRRLSKSKKEEDLKALEEYCYEHSADYQYFEEEWVNIDKILEQMPKIYLSPKNLLKSRENYEVRDTSNYHFLKISDYRLESNVAPLEYIKEDIRSILLNKRKLRLIQELEANIYNDALNRGNFSTY